MKFALLTAAVAFFGAAVAAPLLHKEPSVVQRDVNVLGVRFIPRDVAGMPSPQSVQFAKDKREDVNLALRDDEDFNKRDGDKVIPKIINREPAPAPQVPEEDPAKSDGGEVVPYPKRQEAEPVPEEVPTKSDGNEIIEYLKRQEDVIPAEEAVKSVNGKIEPY